MKVGVAHSPLLVILLCCLCCWSSVVLGQSTNDYRSTQDGAWTTLATWQRYNGATWVAATQYPGQGTANLVTVQADHDVTLNVGVALTVSSLTIEGQTGLFADDATLTVSGATNLSVTNNVIVGPESNAQLAYGGTGNLTVGGNIAIGGSAVIVGSDMQFTSTGTLTVGSLTVGGDSGCSFTQSAGNLSISGALSLSHSSAVVTFSTPGNTTISGTTNNLGSFTDSNDAGIAAFVGQVTNSRNWTTTAVTTPSNMIFRGGIVQNGTFSAGAASFAINNQSITGNNAVSFSNDIIITGITLTMSNGNTLFVGGTTTLSTSGGFTRTNPNNPITFGDNVSVGAGTTFNTSAATNNANLVVFRGGIANNGTFLGGAGTFDTNDQALTGANDIDFTSYVAVTGVTVTNSNTGTVSLTGTNDPVLGGTGSWTQAANSTLEFNGSTISLASMTAASAGNTVNYTRTTGSQTIFNTTSSTYHNLILSGTGNQTKSLSANTTVNGDITIKDQAVFSLGANRTLKVKGDWTNSSTNADPLVEGTNIITFNGTAQQTISNTGDAQGTDFGSVTFANSAATIPQIVIANTTQVRTALNMQTGVIDLSGTTFIMGASGAASTLTRAASTTTNWFYNGTFQHFWPNGQTITNTNYGLFPLGHSVASSYRPLLLSSTAAITAAGSFSAKHTSASSVTDLTPAYLELPANVTITRKHDAQFVTSYSGVTAAPATTWTMSITMTGLPSGTPSEIRMAISNGATTVTHAGTHVAAASATNPTVGRSALALSSFNNADWRVTTISVPTTPLPVELISFTAKSVSGIVNLNWRTASEVNNDFFSLERASDLEKFEALGTVDGAGTSNLPHQYAYDDNAPLYGRSYYRLKQTDFDGKYTYSNVVTIDYNGAAIASLYVFPNPTNGSAFNLVVNGLKEQTSIPVQIVDSRGIIVYENTFELSSPGVFNQKLEFNALLRPGLYFVRAGKTLSLVQKVIVTQEAVSITN